MSLKQLPNNKIVEGKSVFVFEITSSGGGGGANATGGRQSGGAGSAGRIAFYY